VPSCERKPIASAASSSHRLVRHGLSGRGSLVRSRRRAATQGEALARSSSRPAPVASLRRRLLAACLSANSSGLPPFVSLLRVYRRTGKQRSKFRGGRFVAASRRSSSLAGGDRHAARGPAGGRRRMMDGGLRASTPQLGRHLTPGPRLGPLAGNRLLSRDCVPAATFSCGEIRFVAPSTPLPIGLPEAAGAGNAAVTIHRPPD